VGGEGLLVGGVITHGPLPLRLVFAKTTLAMQFRLTKGSIGFGS
jgi:hypothetical protein